MISGALADHVSSGAPQVLAARLQRLPAQAQPWIAAHSAGPGLMRASNRAMCSGTAESDAESVAGEPKATAEAQVDGQHVRTTSGIMADADPRTHRPADVGKVYPLPKATIEQVFPEGLAGLMHKMLFGLDRRRHGPDKNSNRWYESVLKDHPGVLVRKEAMAVISGLHCISKSGTLKGSPHMPTPGFLLDGPPGCGKSMIINHCVHWARSTGEWLVVFIPEPSRLLLGHGLFQRGEGKDSNKIYQPEFAETIIKQIYAANKEKLKEVAYDGSEGATCAEAIMAFQALGASAKEKSAVNVLVNVMGALKTQTAFPLLVAVDEINALRGISAYMDLDMKPVPAANVVVAELFSRFLDADYKRGVVLGAATRTGLYQNVPLPAFRRKPMQVRGINRDELKTFLTFQQNMGELFTPVSDELLDYLLFVTGGRWVDLERMTASELYNLGLNNNPKMKKIGRWFRATKVCVCVCCLRVPPPLPPLPLSRLPSLPPSLAPPFPQPLSSTLLPAPHSA